ncbi:MAG: AMP-binding protein [Desulfobacterota bacterium]|nr:AMP-binding protein [Thermodesulfobacteriota bacterium]
MRDLPPNLSDYEKTYREFKWEIPEYYNFGFDGIDRWAEDRTKLALISVDDTGLNAVKHTFYDLMRLSNQFANLLLRIGIKKGDRVLLMLPRIPEWYVAMMGMIKLGVIPMPTSVLVTPADVKFRVNQAEAVLAITTLEHVTKVAEVQRECPSLQHFIVVGGRCHGWIEYEGAMEASSPKLDQKSVGKTRSSDPLLIFFTSGTESYPKMVLHTHAYPLAHIVTAKYVDDLRDTDLHMAVADTGWAKTAFGKLFGQWICGAAVLQRNPIGGFNPKISLSVIERFGVTTFCASPGVYRMLIQEDLRSYDLQNLRMSLCAGEPLTPEIVKAWKEGTGLDIYEFYGQSETVALLANFRCKPIRYGSIGLPTPGHTMAVVDEEGRELPPLTEGYVALKVRPERPPGLMKEYWRNPEAMEKAFRGDWYFTGDRAYRDEEGYFWFVGRDKELIKTVDQTIAPLEIERVLLEHPAVMEAAVVGIPEEKRGEVITAFVVLKASSQPSERLSREILDYLGERLDPQKRPERIRFLRELPKTTTGKIRRAELRNREIGKGN